MIGPGTAAMAIVAVLFAGCGDSRSNDSDTPDAVSASASAVAVAAAAGDSQLLVETAGTEFVLNLTNDDSEPVETALADPIVQAQLEALLKTEPKRRITPLGDGSAQELWIYPGSALDAPETWSPSVISELVDRGVISDQELEKSRDAGWYLGMSAGFAPDGNWVFLVRERVRGLEEVR